MSPSLLKRTPLFAAHQKLGARLVEFGGWEMPVQYTSILDEHQTVRTAAGLFDALAAGPWALVCVDAELPDGRGVELLSDARARLSNR